jgi:hypothetical protein
MRKPCVTDDRTNREDKFQVAAARAGTWLFAGSLWIAALWCGGCGSGRSGLMPVGGQVTIDGQPVKTGTVMFYPESGRPAVGELGPNGRYTLTTYKEHDGAQLGHYAVTITARRAPAETQRFKSLEEELEYGTAVAEGRIKPDASKAVPPPTKVDWIVSERYSRRDTTDLKADVSRGGGDIDFHLKSKP